MTKVYLITSLLFASNTMNAQDSTWLAFPGSTDTTNTMDSLDFSQKSGTLKIYEDSRLNKIEEFVRADEESVEGIRVDGYRLLIYFNQDKSLAQQQKAHFMSLYPEHSAYIDYLAPNYRVRVGNFRTKLEAEALKAELLAVFPTAIVIKDKIQLPEIDSNSETGN